MAYAIFWDFSPPPFQMDKFTVSTKHNINLLTIQENPIIFVPFYWWQLIHENWPSQIWMIPQHFIFSTSIFKCRHKKFQEIYYLYLDYGTYLQNKKFLLMFIYIYNAYTQQVYTCIITVSLSEIHFLVVLYKNTSRSILFITID